MAFEWDESKRQANVAKHGLDLSRGQELFRDARSITRDSPRCAEARYITIGIMDGKPVTLVWTWRGANRRLISLRRARDAEIRLYRAGHG